MRSTLSLPFFLGIFVEEVNYQRHPNFISSSCIHLGYLYPKKLHEEEKSFWKKEGQRRGKKVKGVIGLKG
jgi:hypothetical protein